MTKEREIKPMLNKPTNGLWEKDIEQVVYERMCRCCPYARNCHDNCTTCDEYEEELEREKNND